MKYDIEQSGSKVRVMFEGDITFSENVSFRELLKKLSTLSISEANLDLSKVGMIDSAGLGMLLIAKEQADTEGWKLRVSGADGHVASMLKLTKLADLLDNI